jgi:hypothetical protein
MDNPAKRLKDILLETSKYSGNDSVQRIKAKVFGLNEEDTVEINRHLLLLVDQFRDIKWQIDRTGVVDSTILLEPLKDFERRLLPADLSSSWSALNTSQIMYALSMCENVIERNAYQKEIEEYKLDELYSDVEFLIEKIHASELIPNLKEALIEKLEDVKRAIQEYRLCGNKGLHRALEGMLGTAFIHWYELIQQRGSEVYTKFWEVSTKIATTLTIVDHADKLPVIYDTLLEGGRRLLSGGD